MQIFVTGGNGFVGRHVVEALLERGDRVAVLVLADEDASWLEDRGVSVHRGDVREPEVLATAMRDAEVVLHLAAMAHVWRPLADYAAVNVAGTGNVCRVARRLGVRRLVHMSSSSVYGKSRGVAVDEHSALAPWRDPYSLTKAEGDILVQRMARDEGLPAVVVRPDQMFGPGDNLHFAATADRIRSGRAIVVGRGDNALPLVYVTDVVQGILLALERDGAIGQAYNLSSEDPITQVQFLSAVAHAIGATPPRVHVPYQVLWAAAWAAERLAVLTGDRRRPPLTRLGVAFLGTDFRVSTEKARQELGYHPQVPLEDGIRRAAFWYRTQSGSAAELLRSAAVG